jgi:hypothetical protein
MQLFSTSDSQIYLGVNYESPWNYHGPLFHKQNKVKRKKFNQRICKQSALVPYKGSEKGDT